MKPFQFKKFTVNQSGKVFRVGTDGVLLGTLAAVENAKNILEVGTGTGLISLMIAQRNPDAEITALDLNENAVDLADENFKNSPFHARMKTILADFKTFETGKKFDLIISNPPYFEENPSGKDVMARQQTELEFGDLIRKSAENLSSCGMLSVIIPFVTGIGFEKKCREHHLFLNRKITVFGIKDAAPKRLILEFSFQEGNTKESEFVIEKSPRKYTDLYLELTKDFHVFRK